MNNIYVNLDQAISLIQNGKVVAIPTETVYGLAGAATNEQALKKIFQIKNRPLFNPIIIHCCDFEQMNQFHTVKHPILKQMIYDFCPGPLTFILNKSLSTHPLITAGQNKVGLRIPNHPITLKLIKQSGHALCAPSANIYGQLSPTTADHVKKIFKNRIPILNGGACTGGIESTVIEPDFNKHFLIILRPGLTSKIQLRKWLDKNKLHDWKITTKNFSTLSPGQGTKHYQPPVPLAIITVNRKTLPTNAEVQSLITTQLQKTHPQTNVDTYIFKQFHLKNSAELSARWLYHDLNILSDNPNHVIYVCQTKQHLSESWEAIWNRLEKAASFHIDIN